MKLIHEYCVKKTGYSISPRDHVDCSAQTRREAGFIQKKVDIEKLSADDILSLYENAKKNKEFPNDEIKSKIRKDNDEYNRLMSESHL